MNNLFEYDKTYVSIIKSDGTILKEYCYDGNSSRHILALDYLIEKYFDDYFYSTYDDKEFDDLIIANNLALNGNIVIFSSYVEGLFSNTILLLPKKLSEKQFIILKDELNKDKNLNISFSSDIVISKKPYENIHLNDGMEFKYNDFFDYYQESINLLNKNNKYIRK